MPRARRDARPPRRRVETTSRDVDVDIDADARAARARRRAVVQRDDAPPAVKTMRTRTRTRTRASTAASKARSPRASSTSSASRPSTSRWTIARRFAVVSVVSLVAAFLAGAKTPTTSRDHRDAFASVSSRRGLAEARARALREALRGVAAPWASNAIDFFIDDVARTPSTKAPTVLLAARTTEAARAVRARLDASFASDACALTVECASRRLREMDADEARGELQRALTRHFRRCADAREGATVVLYDVANMVPAHVPALLPALSEHGAYARDGESVRTSHAVFVLVARLPAIDVSPGANEKTFTNAAKRALLRAMRVREDVDDEDATSLAFRRRVDVAVEV